MDAVAWTTGGLLLLSVGALYAIARSGPKEPRERPARKLLVVVNAAANFGILSAMGLGIPGMLVSLVNLSAAWEDASRLPGYKRILGWTSWLMPMSWPVMLTGSVVFIGDLLAHLLVGDRADRARVKRVEFDASSGTILTEGGLLVRPGFHGGFNFGGFSFITPGADVVIDHESGHAFNLAAFGWIFHLIGGLDRKLRRDPMEAYAERLAEGNRDPSRRDDWIPMWGEPRKPSRADTT